MSSKQIPFIDYNTQQRTLLNFGIVLYWYSQGRRTLGLRNSGQRAAAEVGFGFHVSAISRERLHVQ